MSDIALQDILACPTLPSLPAVASQVLELTRDPDASLSKIASVVQNDQALASKILKTVNSSFYGLSKPCPSISRAMGYLGLNTVKSLALGFSLVDMTRTTEQGFDLTAFWRRSVYSAAGARRIAVLTDVCDPEEAFIAALMQDIGMLALHTSLRTRYANLVRSTGGNHQQLPELEKLELGFDHPAVGAELAGRWRFPDSLVEPIGLHHSNSSSPQFTEIVSTVLLANDIARITEQPSDDTARNICTKARVLFEMKPKTALALTEQAMQDASELATLLGVKTGTISPEIAMLLERAEEARIMHQISVQREAEQLRQSNSDLERQALTDGLTGIANRVCFDQTLDAAFSEAQMHRRPLGLIMLDADRFKLLNDSLGHQAGDEVLKEIAQRLRATVGNRGTVCRYGGEEFAVVLPDRDRMESARIAEQIRLAIADRTIDLSMVDCAEPNRRVTISLGVAAIEADNPGPFTNPTVLLKASDRALYVAKESGRNCVRAFRPRTRSTAA
jgi:two-component system cell cycle response regulator